MAFEVSVCMITYNHAEYVRKAIRGVFNQSLDFKIEFVISDDCSTDNTVKEVEEEIKNSPSNVKVNFIKGIQMLVLI